MSDFAFRPLLVADLPMLHAWLGRPHVAEWWGAPPAFAEVERDYAPMTAAGADSTRGSIALLGQRAVGFIQCYVAMDSGGGWWPDERDPGVRGIDLLLADSADIGRGLGRAMIRAFVDRLFATDPRVTLMQTDPAPDNLRAIRAYEHAGFVAQRELPTPDGAALLMVRRRPDGGSPRQPCRPAAAPRSSSSSPPETDS